MKNKIVFLFIVIIFSNCKLFKNNQSNIVHNKITTIKEKKGIDQFEINKSTLAEVIKKYGQSYEEIKHTGLVYKIEVKYKDLGISFWYYPSDKKKTIYAIDFYEPFTGKTSKGIILNTSKMRDVKKVYGDLNWYTKTDYGYWVSEQIGIEYYVERDTTLPHYPLNEKIHEAKKVIKIKVLDNQAQLEGRYKQKK